MLDNVVFFLKPKDQVQLLYGMMSIQQGLDAMQEAHYTAMPVINQKGQYLGTLSEGDFLWHHLEHPHDMDLEIEKLIRKDFVPLVPLIPISMTSSNKPWIKTLCLS